MTDISFPNPFKPTLILTLVLSASLLVAGLAASAQQQIEEGAEIEVLTDEEITAAVENELLVNPAINSYLIDVTTDDNVVTLSGEVNNVLEKRKATQIAGMVRGVVSVINNIEVDPPARTDQQIQQDVINALLYDAATEAYNVNVSVSDGVVTLNGEVQSQQEKQLAGQVARGVIGVREVRNNIEVDMETTRPEEEIRADVIGALQSDVQVDSALIDVNVEGDTVMLSGTVGSAAERNRAYWDAMVAGVDTVNIDNLDVEWWARDEQQQTDREVTDQEIKTAVERAFLSDPRIESFDLQATVEDGVVTIKGTVNNLKAKKAAAAVAQNTQGVWRVENNLKVRVDEMPEDETIAERVRNQFQQDPWIERYDLSVNVINGSVYLYGTVDTHFERQQAADLASKVKGVINVVNNLEVEQTYAFKTDWEIKEDVIDQFYWSPVLVNENIDVEVEDGVVTLTGEVDTWNEFNAATTNALEAGAKRVRNQLQIRMGPDIQQGYDWDYYYQDFFPYDAIYGDMI